MDWLYLSLRLLLRFYRSSISFVRVLLWSLNCRSAAVVFAEMNQSRHSLQTNGSVEIFNKETGRSVFHVGRMRTQAPALLARRPPCAMLDIARNCSAHTKDLVDDHSRYLARMQMHLRWRKSAGSWARITLFFNIPLFEYPTRSDSILIIRSLAKACKLQSTTMCSIFICRILFHSPAGGLLRCSCYFH